GSGDITFDVGDQIIYNGSIWEKSDTNDSVTSVNSYTGDVTLDTDDIDEGSTNLYSQWETISGGISYDEQVTLSWLYDNASTDVDDFYAPKYLDVDGSGTVLASNEIILAQGNPGNVDIGSTGLNGGNFISMTFDS